MTKNEKHISFRIVENKAPHLCVAYRCGNKRTAKDRFCSKHSHRYQRDTNPIGYVFHALRQNARRRGKEFSITIEEFRTFCEETDYLNKRGKTGKSASIDRIDNSKGYSLYNIRVISLSENSYKRNHEDYAPF